MLFNSTSFFIFFPIVTLGYFLLPHRARTLWLLAASCLFYMAFIPKYIFVLAFTITFDYFAGIYLEKTVGSRKLRLLIGSIIVNIGALFVFKYFNFFNANFAEIARILHLHYSLSALSIILPIGLSFHTFQSLSYTIEVYRGNQKAEQSFLTFALYVMFYPQLVAGPIERPQNMLHQFHEKHNFDFRRLISGLELMLFGFFKKLFIADNLSIFVSNVFDHSAQHGSLSVFVATIFFAFQIYCDFSGYTDIARGAARTMGFELMHNFRQPYFSKSIGEFWRRWHISLSSWFKDYLYIPLGGSRVSSTKQTRNLLITFGLSGLWHGANWTYVVWGLINGVYISAGTAIDKIVSKIKFAIVNIPQFAKDFYATLATFALICLTWIYFRATNIDTANALVYKLFHGWGDSLNNLMHYSFASGRSVLGSSQTIFLAGVFGIVLLIATEYVQIHKYHDALISTHPKAGLALRWFLALNMVLLIMLYSQSMNAQFIYFQF